LERRKKKPGLVRVRRVTRVPGRPAGWPEFGQAVATAGLLLNPDRSSHRVGFNNCGLNISVAVAVGFVAGFFCVIFGGVILKRKGKERKGK